MDEQRIELLALARVPGANRAELCRRYGVSRKTLYKWLLATCEGALPKDRSRRPNSSPKRSPAEVEEKVLALRAEHRWGGRKIARRLQDTDGLQVAPSTVTQILRRYGVLDGPRANRKRDWQRFEREQPNDLWQMDFKGHFGLVSGDRCHPFGCLDDHSRFCLSLVACQDERSRTVRDILSEVFRVYGLPNQILCDNGGCWGNRSARELTSLLIWMSQLGIQVIHGRPYHPQTQGKQERFNESLEFELLDGRGFADLSKCQEAFNWFRRTYNTERPHESLGLDTPASRYTLSPRTYEGDSSLRAPDYPGEFEVRKVQYGGILHFQGRTFRVGKCLHGHNVGVRPTRQDGRYEVLYARSKIAELDLRKHTEEY